jgi:ankyrin repeat protein
MLAGDVNLYKESPAWNLAKAVQREDTILIKRLSLKDTAVLNYRESKFGQSLLEWAVYTNRYQACKALAECGANPNIQSNDGTSAFILAAGKCETSVYLTLFLKYGGDVNAIGKPMKGNEPQQLSTPLTSAAWCNLENVKLLVEAGANVNYEDPFNQSALHSACLGNRIEIVQYLLAKGAEYKKPVSYTLDGKPLYLHQLLRNMPYEIGSKSHKIKMEVVQFLKQNGMDYDKAEIPKRYYDLYSKII